MKILIYVIFVIYIFLLPFSSKAEIIFSIELDEKAKKEISFIKTPEINTKLNFVLIKSKKEIFSYEVMLDFTNNQKEISNSTIFFELEKTNNNIYFNLSMGVLNSEDSNKIKCLIGNVEKNDFTMSNFNFQKRILVTNNLPSLTLLNIFDLHYEKEFSYISHFDDNSSVIIYKRTLSGDLVTTIEPTYRLEVRVVE